MLLYLAWNSAPGSALPLAPCTLPKASKLDPAPPVQALDVCAVLRIRCSGLVQGLYAHFCCCTADPACAGTTGKQRGKKRKAQQVEADAAQLMQAAALPSAGTVQGSLACQEAALELLAALLRVRLADRSLI